MQTAELGREANLIAPRDRGFGGDAGNGDAMVADPGLEQDLGAELFDDDNQTAAMTEPSGTSSE
jgi:hypothetical protein